MIGRDDVIIAPNLIMLPSSNYGDRIEIAEYQGDVNGVPVYVPFQSATNRQAAIATIEALNNKVSGSGFWAGGDVPSLARDARRALTVQAESLVDVMPDDLSDLDEVDDADDDGDADN